MTPSSDVSSGNDDSLEKRMRQEIDAALRSSDARAAAAHVEMANRYLVRLTGAQKREAV